VRLLLDTHAFIWWDSQPERLSPQARAALEDPLNTVLMSVASLWEIQIKRAVGKLMLRAPLETLVADQQANGFHLLPVTLGHVLALDPLPLHHRDPFDRMLAAQAPAEGAVLVTRDPVFDAYPVQTLW
jgi:PIN domain nuclease of toxin-antitoxin system